MTLDLDSAKLITSDLAMVLAVIAGLGMTLMVVSTVIDRVKIGLAGGAIFFLVAIPLWAVIERDSKLTPSAEEVAISQIEAHYGVTIPKTVMKEYLVKYKSNGDALRYEFEMVADNSLDIYALKEQDGKVYLFKKAQNEFEAITPVN